MTFHDELKQHCESLDDASKSVVAPLIEEIVFQRQQLLELRKDGFRRYNPNNPEQWRFDKDAQKAYKELFQQFCNGIKVILGAFGKVEGADESPLRQYLNQLRGDSG